MQKYLNNIGNNAKKAFLSKLDNKLKNKVLSKFAKLVKINKANILRENSKDIGLARKKGLKPISNNKGKTL